MNITAQEEYGLRCLLRVAMHERGEPMRTQEVAVAEGISLEYAAKLMRTLKNEGFVDSTRGAAGGYLLSRPARAISVWEVLEALGGPLYEEKFCDAHTGLQANCINTTDCAIRSVWRNVNQILKTALSGITLADLTRKESDLHALLLAAELRRSAEATAEDDAPRGRPLAATPPAADGAAAEAAR